MRQLGIVLPVLMALSALPHDAGAISNLNSRLALHLVPAHAGSACLTGGGVPACSQINTQGDLTPHYYFGYLLVTQGDPVAGITGLQCGIHYNPTTLQGVDVFGWTLCGTLEFSTGWPQSGGSILVTWDSMNKCQRFEPGGAGTGVVAVAGYFYLGAYTPDRMDVIPRPIDGFAKVADCSSSEAIIEGGAVHHDPSHLGSATFSAGATTPGFNPCDGQGGPPPQCLINGPDTVREATDNVHYGVNPLPPGGVQWSITGNATITSGATDAEVVVSTTTIGTFFLTLTSNDHTVSCQRAIAVTPLDCLVTGPASVLEHAANLAYSAGTQLPGSAYVWSTSGNGSIAGSTTGPSCVVTAGVPGGLGVHVQITRGGFTQQCFKSVTVMPAGPCAVSQTDANILVHLRPATPQTACLAAPGCAEVKTAGALYPATYFAYVMVTDASATSGIAGVEFGIQYDNASHSGVDIYSWMACGNLEFKTNDWPASGSGNRITWIPTTNCQRNEPGGPGTGVSASAGYFYLAAYSPDHFAIRPHPATGEAKLADCLACESVVATVGSGLWPNLGMANFTAGGTAAGYNPCGNVVPVLPTTWSAIKAYLGSGPSAAPRNPASPH